ncbi:MAG: fused MFS/spermidine synthase, partial [Chlorobia bacterium]|nr:fused MFS/spermidine synthase [Fimbriimonadaceae bacterium]
SPQFSGLIALMAICAMFLQKQQRPVEEVVAERVESEPISSRQRLTWVLLAAVPSSLLLGVTNYMTTNLAPMPLLWIVPLTIYLITFIVAFARKQWVKSAVWARILPLVVTPLALVMILEATEPMMILAAMHLLAFTIAALMCHTRLVETRPSASKLTEFYVWLSVGGAIGGLFNALLAPTIFSTLAEYPIALIAACLIRPARVDKAPRLRLDIAFALGMLVVVICLGFIVRELGMPPSQARTALVIGLPAILCFLMVDHPIRYGLMIGAVFLGSNLMQTSSAGTIAYTGRSFFGVHRVVYTSKGRFHELVHGNTLHGIQDTLNPGEPKTYYTRNGPVGQVFEAYPNLPHVALVGMGVGSCAAYGRPGQKLTYFEIDPVVDQIAKDPKHFTFLRDTKADLDVVLGDARLTLGRQDGPYNLIALDAFSSDSIPIHLLTKEAVAMYLSKLTPDGFLAFHISNRYLQLEPILAKLAESLNMVAYSLVDAPTDEETRVGKRPSHWMVLARSKADVAKLVDQSAWQLSPPDPSTPIWTDDYSNILSAYDPD